MRESKGSLCGQLFSVFFRIGAFTFGGGYAMIPLIKEETVTNKKWISDKDILDVVAIAESTPGPIAINSATFIGYRVAGLAGSICATLGVVLPSFMIIFAISFVLKQFEELRAIQYAFVGIRAAVLALILNALLGLYRACPKGAMEYGLMAVCLIAVTFLKLKVIYLILLSAAVGILWSLAVGKKVAE